MKRNAEEQSLGRALSSPIALPVLLFLFVLIYLGCFVIYNSYYKSGIDSKETQIIEVLFTRKGIPPILNGEGDYDTFNLTLEYPSELPPAGAENAERMLRLYIWRWRRVPLMESLGTPSLINSSCPVTAPLSSPDKSGRGPWLLIWSPSHSAVMRQKPGEEGKYFTFIDLRADIQASTTYTFLLSQGRVKGSPSQVDLCIYLLDYERGQLPFYSIADPSHALDNIPLVLPVQVRFEAMLVNAFKIIFGGRFNSNCITFPALLSLAGIVLQWYDSQRRRRDDHLKSLQERVAQLEISSWEDLWALRQDIKEQGAQTLRDRLDAYIRDTAQRGSAPWLYGMRKWLYRKLRNVKAEGQRRKLLEELVGLKLLNGYQASDVVQLWQAATERNKSEGWAQSILKLVDLLGLSVVEQITEGDGSLSEEEKGVWKDTPLGRYLLHNVGETKEVQDGYKASYENLHVICHAWQKFSMPIDTPFGPLKAENDPRLGQSEAPLFWTGHPKWKEVDLKASGLYLFLAGGGLTAFRLYAQYEHAPYGVYPSLSVHLCLERSLEGEAWLHRIHDAFSESLLCALASDPVWLITSNGKCERHEIIFVLQHYLLNHRISLAEALRLRGKEVQYSARRLLIELFYSLIEGTIPPLSWELLYAAVRNAQCRLALYTPREEYLPIFFWVEVVGRDDKARGDMIRWIAQERHLRDLGFIKLFSRNSEELLSQLLQWQDEIDLPVVKVEWSFNDLLKMAEHRFNQVRGDDEQWEKFKKWAQGQEGLWSTPRELIQAGNKRKYVRDGNGGIV